LEQEYDFYQVIDKLDREEPETNQEKLAALGFSLVEVMAFIEKAEPTAELQVILDNLAARGLDDYVKIDYGVIRGLAYYTGIVFEAFDRRGELRAIAGGGRYDNLIKLISGGKVNLPALGFGMGDVVLLELLKARGLLPKFDAALDVFCLIEDESLRRDSLKLIQDLRETGLVVDYSLTPAKPDKQFKRAQELRAAHTLKLERNAAGEMVARVKHLQTREEQTLAMAEAAKSLKAGVESLKR
jgi:histidyl-tRNA synthetase